MKTSLSEIYCHIKGMQKLGNTKEDRAYSQGIIDVLHYLKEVKEDEL